MSKACESFNEGIYQRVVRPHNGTGYIPKSYALSAINGLLSKETFCREASKAAIGSLLKVQVVAYPLENGDFTEHSFQGEIDRVREYCGVIGKTVSSVRSAIEEKKSIVDGRVEVMGDLYPEPVVEVGWFRGLGIDSMMKEQSEEWHKASVPVNQETEG